MDDGPVVGDGVGEVEGFGPAARGSVLLVGGNVGAEVAAEGFVKRGLADGAGEAFLAMGGGGGDGDFGPAGDRRGPGDGGDVVFDQGDVAEGV